MSDLASTVHATAHISAAQERARRQVAEMQRSRLLGAAVSAVEELGYAQATVAQITSRARISRRTFYDLFEDREDCLLAALEATVGRVASVLEAHSLEGLRWHERLRVGLWEILCFFDREPALARLCVVQSARGSRRVLEYREKILAGLARVVDEGRLEGTRAGECPPLISEGLVGAALAILYARLLARKPEPLSELLGELMGLLVVPYLGSGAARRERSRPAPALPESTVGHGPRGVDTEGVLQALPMRLTYRTACVLEAVAANPGTSNRLVGEHIGMVDQGQLSKLLGRLEHLGLLQNTGKGQLKGEANAWHLSPTGLKVTQSIRGDGRLAHAPGAQ